MHAEAVKYFLEETLRQAYSCAYTVGSMVNPTMNEECVPCIHFVSTQEEALSYHDLYPTINNIEAYAQAEEIEMVAFKKLDGNPI